MIDLMEKYLYRLKKSNACQVIRSLYVKLVKCTFSLESQLITPQDNLFGI